MSEPVAFLTRRDGSLEACGALMPCEICQDAEACEGIDCPSFIPSEADLEEAAMNEIAAWAEVRR